MPADLSVIICTRNRCGLLKKTVEALVHQQCAPWTFEIIVVDNGSTDETKSVVESFAKRSANLKYLYESRPGIGHARNIGFGTSSGRFIAYLDDDAVPVAGWCAAICKVLQQSGLDADSRLGAIGGPIAPVFEGGKPSWISPKLGFAYAVVDLGRLARRFPPNRVPLSANMALPRAVHEANTWNEALLMCEEADLCGRIARRGLKFVYIPEMKVHHFIPQARLTVEWLEKRYFAEGVAQRYLRLGIRRRARFTTIAFTMLPLFWVLSRTGPPGRKLLYHCRLKSYSGYLAGLFGMRGMDSLPYVSWRRQSET
jgi:glucosyl-dolichyl phosphate glucuronosyltransferase